MINLLVLAVININMYLLEMCCISHITNKGWEEV